ncbi:MAG: IS66 family transposase [Candidatus Thiodiazotropha taylori]|nr:IS66 family transposase [Candidatus Thiodiazotropha taylori]MCW4311005.1 IS66 family transposase [Candidatus Thiodiazotropha endolucinida]
MDVQDLQEITITRKEIREIYDQGPEAVETLVLALVDKINFLTSVVKEQDLRINKLEESLGKNSRNSSKPPSTDSPYKNREKKKKKKKHGEKKKRTGTTLNQVSDPDEIISCKVVFCEHCHRDLSSVEAKDIDKRQVTDIPPVKAFTTEYQGEVKECPNCYKTNKAVFPDGVTHKAQYGPGVQAVAVYLRNYQLIPLERTIELLRDLLGISLSEGSLVNMTTRCADRLSGFMETVKQKLTAANIMHNDETGINVGGILHWLHTAGNQEYTYLFPHKKRGSTAFEEMGILPDFQGVSVHDFWKPYEKYDCSHAYCNAHLIRELTFAHENLKQNWAGRMIRLMLNMKEKVDKSEKGFLEKDTVSEFIRKYKNIIKQAYKANPLPKKTGKRGRPKKGKVLCLVERLDNHREDILRFMKERNVPFDNNLAERDLRMVKVRQKISGTFRNLDRVKDYCRIRSYISTVKKQGEDVFPALVATFTPNFEKILQLYS